MCALYWPHKHPLLDQKNKSTCFKKNVLSHAQKEKQQQNWLVVSPQFEKYVPQNGFIFPQFLVIENSVPKNTSKCHHTWQFCWVTSLGSSRDPFNGSWWPPTESPGPRKTPESSDRVSFPNVCNAVVGPPRFTRDLKTRGAFTDSFFLGSMSTQSREQLKKEKKTDQKCWF